MIESLFLALFNGIGKEDSMEALRNGGGGYRGSSNFLHCFPINENEVILSTIVPTVGTSGHYNSIIFLRRVGTWNEFGLTRINKFIVTPQFRGSSLNVNFAELQND